MSQKYVPLQRRKILKLPTKSSSNCQLIILYLIYTYYLYLISTYTKMEQDFTYKNRIVDSILTEQLEAAGMILIQGPNGAEKRLLPSSKPPHKSPETMTKHFGV